MVVRITKTVSDERTVLRVDGLLQAADVEALNHEWETAGGAVTLELSQLRSADARGVEAIPASLADSLMGRLDRLSAAKEVAQPAAVLGRAFGYPLLVAMAGMDEAALRHGLGRLVDAEILFARGEPPAATFTFKHALIQETAYQSLLKRTRQQLHTRTAHVLEERFPERVATEPEVLARHYDQAGLAAQAITHYQNERMKRVFLAVYFSLLMSGTSNAQSPRVLWEQVQVMDIKEGTLSENSQ